jgi:adenosylcobinamide kinase/adenosylcobinamide-phosphate guanylyltransferase
LLILVLGGTASGKSDFAIARARASGAHVTFLPTGVAADSEMRERIEAHRRERPAEWTVVEEPLRLADAVSALDDGEVVLVDSISGWLGNRMEAAGGADVDWSPARARSFADECVAAITPLLARSGQTVCVSAEVGLAPVALSPYGRGFADALGRLNQELARVADEVHLVVAGMSIPIHTFRGEDR